MRFSLERLVRPAPGEAAVVPEWLTAGDHPWLRVLVDEHARFVGRPRRELLQRLAQPLPCWAPRARMALAAAVLARFFRGSPRAGSDARAAREQAFLAGARCADRGQALALAALAHGSSAAALEAALFADLPGERLVVPRGDVPPLPELVLHTNLLLAQSLLQRAFWLRVEIEGRTRAVVRQAKLRGLLCTVAPGDAGLSLSLSGPLLLFKRTLLYGRALATIVPVLKWCHRYSGAALCAFGRGERVVRLHSGDPVFPSGEPEPFASRVEARFARDFARLAPEWDLIPEPEPVRAGETLIFPDFLLRHRTDAGREWLLEIVGFWTDEYLRQKLARLREARIENLVLCIDAARACGDADLPAKALVLRYRGAIDARLVLARIGGGAREMGAGG